jgi:murein L,D-transpeptidase YcbB/YkuD
MADPALELLASDAFLQQVRHRSTGAVSPRELDPDWHLIPAEADPLQTLRHVLATGASVRRTLDGLWPRSHDYRELVSYRARILELGEVAVEPVPPGPLLRTGQSGERVVALKNRLLGPGEHSPVFDETVTLHLASPLPTFLVYFTAFTDAAGEVVFRRDIYQRDAALIAALRRGSRS